MKYIKKSVAFVLAGILLIGGIAACTRKKSDIKETTSIETTKEAVEEVKIPKYVFLFIGDGMSYPQVQATAYFLGKSKKLPFMEFPSVGMMTTYNSESTITDSASAATAMATGHKTSSGTLGMNENNTVSYPTIAEYLKDSLGYKIGLITTVSLNHATPAGFYAHQSSRKNYYQIGTNMISSNFDFFAGGGFTDSKGTNGKSKSLYTIASEAGYNIVKGYKEKEALTQESSDKTILLSETRVDEELMKYDMDLEENEWHLSDYVSKGIEMLDNDKGFFMMVEGGKIDYANHSQDAATMIKETLAFSDSVDAAVEFYNNHPDETLIIVTADHESGGLTVGYSQTKYSTYLSKLSNQTISFSKFNSDFVSKYKKENTAFEEVIEDIEDNYGVSFSDEETETLQKAYIRTLKVGALSKSEMTDEEYELYGTYEPITITISHIMAHKAGLNYSTYAHTGIPVPVYAMGFGAEMFNGSYDNTDIFNKLYELMDL